jgi:hypothetical protein
MVTRSRSLSPKSFSDGLLSEAMNLAGDNDLFDSSTDFLPELWDSLCTWGIEIRYCSFLLQEYVMCTAVIDYKCFPDGI